MFAVLYLLAVLALYACLLCLLTILACCACLLCLLAVLDVALGISFSFIRAVWSLLDGWLTANHLSAIGGSRACLLKSILAAGGGLGPHAGGPWRCQGLGLGPGLARGRQNGLDCTPVRAGALFYWDPGIQVTTKVGGDLLLFGRTVYCSI